MKVNPRSAPRVERKIPSWLRILAFLLGIYLLSWLPIEDKDETRALLSAAALNAWVAARYIICLPIHAKKSPVRHTVTGALAGLTVTPTALFLMAFKTGIHGHESPDFTGQQVMAVVYNTPIWASAGLLLGLGSGLVYMATHD